MTTPKARGNLQVVAGVTKKPDLSDPVLRAKLAKGMGHNYYGEPAWPNDLLYIFPVVILGTIACVVGLAVMEPTQLGEPADPFATPLEILPEWYFFPTFNALRVIPNKLLGVLSMAAVPVGPHHRPLPGVHQQVPEPLPPPRRHLRLPHRHLLRHLDGHRRHHAHRQGHLPRASSKRST